MTFGSVSPFAHTFPAGMALKFLPAEIEAVRQFGHQMLAFGSSEIIDAAVGEGLDPNFQFADGSSSFLNLLTSRPFRSETVARFAHYLNAVAKVSERIVEGDEKRASILSESARRAEWAVDRHRLSLAKPHSNEWLNMGANGNPELGAITVDGRSVAIEVGEVSALALLPGAKWDILRTWRGPLVPLYFDPPSSTPVALPEGVPVERPQVNLVLSLLYYFANGSTSEEPSQLKYKVTIGRKGKDVYLRVKPALPQALEDDEVAKLIARQRAAAWLSSILIFFSELPLWGVEDQSLITREIAPTRSSDWVETPSTEG